MKLYFILAVLTLLTSQHLAASKEAINLERCHIENYSQEVFCGSHTVFEDRVAASGRTIDIKFAVVPSITEAKELDPLVFLAGGPGQGGIAMAPFVKIAFSEVNENRDIILIDQRGMGDSNSLACDEPESNIFTMTEAEKAEFAKGFLKKCLTKLDADVTLYNQDIANQDIHEVLSSLGYDKVNLYGVSWGTRSALLYANQFPEQVRTIIMDGNAPLANRVPLFSARDSQRALGALFKDCRKDQACNKTFPSLEQDFKDVLASFSQPGKRTTVIDATTGKSEDILLSLESFTNSILGILYVPEFSRLIPLVIDQAKENKYHTLLGISAAFGDAGISIGAQLSILCSEDLSRISDSEIERANSEGFIGNSFINTFKTSCSVWPKSPLPAIYNQPLVSEIPTLILSGEIDPITPPHWGEKMTEHMTNSKHLIAANTGHNVAPKGCAADLMAQFINQGNLDDIDGSCLDDLKRPTFFIDASGPSRSKNND
jgi:pimeloyl-ACP methyl ester carboxylesterase